jgi:7,8-dihydropterin-6-yl-methyl-4-(beta-D-ribofuranosyl)aminobenzene 5'-phosphate synthase
VGGSARADIPVVDSLEIQSVVDNFYDTFQANTTLATRWAVTNQTDIEGIRVQAEMGLGYVVTATVNGVKHKILFDFGLSKEVYENNANHLGLDISDAEALVLSHQHQDHWGGVDYALDQTKGSRAPFYVGGEDAFAHNYVITPTAHVDLGQLDRNTVSQHHRPINIVTTPTLIAGSGLLTGTIPKTDAYEVVPPSLQQQNPDGTISPASMSHELAIVFNVRGRGLVVLAACAHRGMINTTRYAQQITGINTVYAIIGGFHLTTSPQAAIDATVADLALIAPTFIAPMHCVGNRAQLAFQKSFPAAYVHPSVGTRYIVQGVATSMKIKKQNPTWKGQTIILASN